MRNILLLGSFGFIGTNIVKYIDKHSSDVNIIAFDRFPAHLDHIEFQSINKTYAGDFADEFLMEKIFSENKIDLVIHSLSASVPSSSQDNAFDLQFNVLPTISLLNTMTRHGVDKIVFISSGGAIYGDHYVDRRGHREDEVLFPKSAYGVSKLVIEKYLYLYQVQYGVKSLVLRLSNPYGPYHYSQKQGIINIAMERALKNELFEIWGEGNGLKDYIYIGDFCKIVMNLINMEWAPYKVLNVGSGELLSVNEIVSCIKQFCPDFTWKHKEANALDVKEFRLNLSKLKEDFNIKFTPINEGLRLLKDWYEKKYQMNVLRSSGGITL